MGDLLNAIRNDIKQITGNTGDFAIPLTFTAPDGTTKVINGIYKKHHLSYDTDGRAVSSKNGAVSVAEGNFVAAEYPVRTNGVVNLEGHTVEFADSTGNSHKYAFSDWFPDETVGLIICILNDHE